MRTYGRTVDLYGNKTWRTVTTAPNGDNSLVYITTLCQVLQLVLGESPFWGQYGIPAPRSVLTQVAPDFYAAQTQGFFARYFASLIISRVAIGQTTSQVPSPTYRVSVVTLTGAVLPPITVPTGIPI